MRVHASSRTGDKCDSVSQGSIPKQSKFTIACILNLVTSLFSCKHKVTHVVAALATTPLHTMAALLIREQVGLSLHWPFSRPSKCSDSCSPRTIMDTIWYIILH